MDHFRVDLVPDSFISADVPKLRSDKKLLPYQTQCVEQILANEQNGRGSILVLPMGYGKTLIALAVTESTHHPDRQTLLICPTNVLYTVLEELIKWYAVVPSYCVYTTRKCQDISRYTFVITTYKTLSQSPVLSKNQWYRVIVDESHTLRNLSTVRYQLVHQLRYHTLLCMSGTPFYRTWGDIRSQFLLCKAPAELVNVLCPRTTLNKLAHSELVTRHIVRVEDSHKSIHEDINLWVKQHTVAHHPNAAELDIYRSYLHKCTTNEHDVNDRRLVQKATYGGSLLHGTPHVLDSTKGGLICSLITKVLSGEHTTKCLVLSRYTTVIRQLFAKFHGTAVLNDPVYPIKRKNATLCTFRFSKHVQLCFAVHNTMYEGLNLGYIDNIILCDPIENAQYMKQLIFRFIRINYTKNNIDSKKKHMYIIQTTS